MISYACFEGGKDYDGEIYGPETFLDYKGKDGRYRRLGLEEHNITRVSLEPNYVQRYPVNDDLAPHLKWLMGEEE